MSLFYVVLCACISSQQVVYSASHIDAIPDSLVSSVASSSSTTAQLTQSTASTSGPIAMPSVVDVAGGGGTGGPGYAIVPNSILGQSEVVTQIQGAMADLQGQLMSGAGAAIESAVLTENAQGSAALLPGQTTTAANAGIQDSIMTQTGVVGGDSIQDSIQDSIMGEGGPGAVAAAALLGQVGGGKTTGIQDSSQFLNPAASAAVPGNLIGGGGGGGASSGGGGEGPTSVSDIASQLISQYVASSQAVPAPFQAPATNAGMEQGQVESMQTDVVPQPAETTLPSSVNT